MIGHKAGIQELNKYSFFEGAPKKNDSVVLKGHFWQFPRNKEAPGLFHLQHMCSNPWSYLLAQHILLLLLIRFPLVWTACGKTYVDHLKLIHCCIYVWRRKDDYEENGRNLVVMGKRSKSQNLWAKKPHWAGISCPPRQHPCMPLFHCLLLFLYP